jgi:hypothetical protein
LTGKLLRKVRLFGLPEVQPTFLRNDCASRCTTDTFHRGAEMRHIGEAQEVNRYGLDKRAHAERLKPVQRMYRSATLKMFG